MKLVPTVALLVPGRREVPLPGVHSPMWAPEREPTIKAAIGAETAILMDLLQAK